MRMSFNEHMMRGAHLLAPEPAGSLYEKIFIFEIPVRRQQHFDYPALREDIIVLSASS